MSRSAEAARRSATPFPSKRARVLRGLRVAVALGLTSLIAWRAGVGDVGRDTALSVPWVVLAAAIVPASIGVRAYNHALLLNRPTKVLGFRDAYLLTVAGIGINLFVPTGAADLAKAGWGARIHGNPEAMIVSAVLDKLTSLAAVGALGSAASFVVGSPVLGWTAAALVAASVLPLLAPRLMPWRPLLRVLAPGTTPDPSLIAAVSRPPAALLAWVYAVSVAGWLLTYWAIWACCRAVGADIGLEAVFAMAPLTSVARLLPVSIAGIGVGEATLALLLQREGVPPESAAQAVLLAMVLLVLLPGAVGAVIVARGRAAD